MGQGRGERDRVSGKELRLFECGLPDTAVLLELDGLLCYWATPGVTVPRLRR